MNFQRIVELKPPHEDGITLQEAIRLSGTVTDRRLAQIRDQAERETGQKPT